MYEFKNSKISKFFVVLCTLLLIVFLWPIPPAQSAVTAGIQMGSNFIRGLGLMFVMFILNELGVEDREVDADPEDPEPEDPVPGYTSEEHEQLSQIIYAEARGEPLIGQVAVGAVVLNRVFSSEYPDTIEEVIHQPMQFEPVRRGLVGPVNRDSDEAASRAMQGEDPTFGAEFFYNAEVLLRTGRVERLEWFQRATEVTTKIGSHTFARAR